MSHTFNKYQPDRMVREFHEKHGFSIDGSAPRPPKEVREQADHALVFVGRLLKELSRSWQHGTLDRDVYCKPGETYDDRLMRGHLILEEIGELLIAMGVWEPDKIIDGIGDSLYVLHGTGVAFGVPCEAVVAEIHASNMTKEVGAGGDKDVRCRKKGESYRAPNLGAVMRAYVSKRAQGAPPHQAQAEIIAERAAARCSEAQLAQMQGG